MDTKNNKQPDFFHLVIIKPFVKIHTCLGGGMRSSSGLCCPLKSTVNGYLFRLFVKYILKETLVLIPSLISKS